jgi:FSR family fosmidomycin resistance protein-like MFS transporter
LIIASLPLLQKELALSLTKIGIIAAVFQLSSSVCQPIIGWLNDKHPQPYALPLGMASTTLGILLLAYSGSYYLVLIAVTFIGIGSAVFHPEASRLVFLAAGKRRGLAQSIFQTGGNAGGAVSPLLAALLITPYGQQNIAWFAILSCCAILWMIPLSRWHSRRLKERELPENRGHSPRLSPSGTLPKRTVFFAIVVLLILLFSKNLYTISLHIFLPFYLIEKYQISIEHSQLFLFAFLFAVAAGTMIGGPIGDKIGRKWVIWFSILGVAPLTLWLPHVQSLWGTCLLSMLIGAIMASSFPAIVILAQELMPGKIGTVGGLFFGFSFGSAAIASTFLGGLADYYESITTVYKLCAFMPLLGLMTWFLPNFPATLPPAP